MTRRAAVDSGREHTGDRQTDGIWSRLGALARIVARSPFIDGRLITEEDAVNVVAGSGLVFVAGTARSIAHQLGRRARGFVEVGAVDVPSAGHVGLRAVEHPSGFTSRTHITVRPDASGTCWIWVF